MNAIVEKRLADLSNRPRNASTTFWRSAKREMRAVPDAMRWLLGIER